VTLRAYNLSNALDIVMNNSLYNLSPERPTNREISRVIELFANESRCFKSWELLEWMNRDIVHGDVLQTLIEDPRFTNLGVYPDGGSYFISENALFRWYIRLTLRLAQIPLAKLTQKQLASIMYPLITGALLETPPPPVIYFGKRFGFIDEAPTPSSFVFPLASVISCFSSRNTGLAAEFLESLGDFEKRSLTLDQTLVEATEVGFNTFDEKTVYVLKRREGLTPEGEMTLAKIGAKMNLTRERIRQIEESFWKNLRHPKSSGMRYFLVAFVVDIMHKHGSLIVKEHSPDAPITMFLAKCLGLQSAELEQTGLVVLGSSSKHLASLNVSKRGVPDQFPYYLDKEFIAGQLATLEDFCLTSNDISVLVAAVSDKWMRQLDKGQRVYLALRELREPTHFSAVTEQYNSMFPDDESSERAIHGILSRELYGVVWVGSKGLYGLKEWGNERPTETLFNTATQIITKRYLETREPVPESFISTELGKYRYSVDRTSFLFVTHGNADLRAVLGRAFVPVALVNRRPDEANDASLTRIELKSEKWRAMDAAKVDVAHQIDSLPIPFICGPEFLGKQKERVLSLGEEFSVVDLKQLLHTGIGPARLAHTFATIFRIEQADEAIRRFSNAVMRWETGERRDSRVTWIIPDRFLSSDLSIHPAGSDLFLKVLRSNDNKQLRELEIKSGFQQWLPFLSLELTNIMRSLQPGDFSVLQKMLLKASQYAKGTQVLGPWDPGFPHMLQRLCLYSLYQFEPTSQALNLLMRLNEALCTNIGHLVVFHPEACRLVRELDSRLWTKLTIAFSQVT